MISSYHERVGDGREQSILPMVYRTRLAMQGQRSSNRDSAKCLVHALHSEANAKNGDSLMLFSDQIDGYSGCRWILRTGTDQDVVRCPFCYFLDRDLVGAEDGDRKRILAKHLDQIEGEGVIVV